LTVPFYGFRGASFGDKLTVSKVYGMGKHNSPRGRTRGKYETDPVKLNGPVGTAERLRAAIAEAAGTSVIGQFEFDGVMHFIENEATSEELPVKVEYKKLRLVGDANTLDEGPDKLREELEIDVILILRNGRSLAEPVEGV